MAVSGVFRIGLKTKRGIKGRLANGKSKDRKGVACKQRPEGCETHHLYVISILPGRGTADSDDVSTYRNVIPTVFFHFSRALNLFLGSSWPFAMRRRL